MTSTHTPTEAQSTREWALDIAQRTLIVSSGGGFFDKAKQDLSGGVKDLIKLADYLIGEPEPEDDDEAIDVVHTRVHELTPEQAVDVAMHAFQHSGVPIVVAADLGNLADLPESELNKLVNEAILGLNKLPTNVQAFIDRNKGVAGIDLDAPDFIEKLIRRLSGDETTVSVKDGSLVVDDAEAEKDDNVAEQAEGGDNRTAETDAVVDEAKAADESAFDDIVRGDDKKA